MGVETLEPTRLGVAIAPDVKHIIAVAATKAATPAQTPALIAPAIANKWLGFA